MNRIRLLGLFALKILLLIIVWEGDVDFYGISRMCADQLFLKIIDIETGANGQISSRSVGTPAFEFHAVDGTNVVDMAANSYHLIIAENYGEIVKAIVKHALIRESFSVLAWGNSHLFAEDTGKIPKVMETDAGCDLADLQGRDVQIINCPSDPLLPDVGSDGHAGLFPEIAGE